MGGAGRQESREARETTNWYGPVAEPTPGQTPSIRGRPTSTTAPEASTSRSPSTEAPTTDATPHPAVAASEAPTPQASTSETSTAQASTSDASTPDAPTSDSEVSNSEDTDRNPAPVEYILHPTPPALEPLVPVEEPRHMPPGLRPVPANLSEELGRAGEHLGAAALQRYQKTSLEGADAAVKNREKLWEQTKAAIRRQRKQGFGKTNNPWEQREAGTARQQLAKNRDVISEVDGEIQKLLRPGTASGANLEEALEANRRYTVGELTKALEAMSKGEVCGLEYSLLKRWVEEKMGLNELEVPSRQLSETLPSWSSATKPLRVNPCGVSLPPSRESTYQVGSPEQRVHSSPERSPPLPSSPTISDSSSEGEAWLCDRGRTSPAISVSPSPSEGGDQLIGWESRSSSPMPLSLPEDSEVAVASDASLANTSEATADLPPQNLSTAHQSSSDDSDVCIGASVPAYAAISRSKRPAHRRHKITFSGPPSPETLGTSTYEAVLGRSSNSGDVPSKAGSTPALLVGKGSSAASGGSASSHSTLESPTEDSLPFPPLDSVGGTGHKLEDLLSLPELVLPLRLTRPMPSAEPVCPMPRISSSVSSSPAPSGGEPESMASSAPVRSAPEGQVMTLLPPSPLPPRDDADPFLPGGSFPLVLGGGILASVSPVPHAASSGTTLVPSGGAASSTGGGRAPYQPSPSLLSNAPTPAQAPASTSSPAPAPALPCIFSGNTLAPTPPFVFGGDLSRRLRRRPVPSSKQASPGPSTGPRHDSLPEPCPARDCRVPTWVDSLEGPAEDSSSSASSESQGGEISREDIKESMQAMRDRWCPPSSPRSNASSEWDRPFNLTPEIVNAKCRVRRNQTVALVEKVEAQLKHLSRQLKPQNEPRGDGEDGEDAQPRPQQARELKELVKRVAQLEHARPREPKAPTPNGSGIPVWIVAAPEPHRPLLGGRFFPVWLVVLLGLLVVLFPIGNAIATSQELSRGCNGYINGGYNGHKNVAMFDSHASLAACLSCFTTLGFALSFLGRRRI